MTKLYSKLAKVYHEMYQSIFDYKKEFQFYSRILKKYKVNKVLEIGCGSGNLAPYFLKAKYDYLGLDLFEAMLKIARKVEPKADFIQGDMRKLNLKKKFDAVIVSGRSFTYMTTNSDVESAFNSIFKVLKKGGILIFDNFNAERMMESDKRKFEQKSEYNGTKYRRVSVNTVDKKNNWLVNWDATYYVKEKGKKVEIIKDKSVLRSFTKDELQLFLKLSKFKFQSVIDQDFAFTIIAKK